MNASSTRAPTLDEALAALLVQGYTAMGEVAISAAAGLYALCHRDDLGRPPGELQSWSQPEDAVHIALYDDAGAYRPLKTAPNLRHGWRLELADLSALRLALEGFYPGRLAAFLRWREGRLGATPLRETLSRQTGMYRVTQRITDEQATAMVGRVCRSEGGCARTILWSLNSNGGEAALKAVLPPEKFDPLCDQVLAGRIAGENKMAVLPMFCQEACNLLVAEARVVVKSTVQP